MAASVIVDAGFLVALLSRRDSNHRWAADQSPRLPPPWRTCEAALSEAFHLLGRRGGPALAALLRRRAVVSAFHLGEGADEVLKLMQKYADVPMSFADACLVRMTEVLADPILPYHRHRLPGLPAAQPTDRSLRGSGMTGREPPEIESAGRVSCGLIAYEKPVKTARNP